MAEESMSSKKEIYLVRNHHLFIIKVIDIDRDILMIQPSLLSVFILMFNKDSLIQWFPSQLHQAKAKMKATFIILNLILFQLMQKVHLVKDLACKSQLKKLKENKLKPVIIKFLPFSRFWSHFHYKILVL